MIPGIPTLKLVCNNGHTWYCIIPGWTSNWKVVECPECKCKPETFTWGGFRDPSKDKDANMPFFDDDQPESALDILGLEYHPNFLSSKEQENLIQVIDEQRWVEDEGLKRRVQQYGYKYDYRNRTVDRSLYLGPLPKFIQIPVRNLMRTLIKFEPNQAIINEYLPGQGISQHIDCAPCFEDTIVTISLGWVYPLDLFNPNSRETRSLNLELGSVLILSGHARYNWMHGIRARKKDNGIARKRRISITLRKVKLK